MSTFEIKILPTNKLSCIIIKDKTCTKMRLKIKVLSAQIEYLFN